MAQLDPFFAGEAYVFVAVEDYRTFISIVQRMNVRWQSSPERKLHLFVPPTIPHRNYAVLRIESGSLVWSAKPKTVAERTLPVITFTQEMIPSRFWLMRMRRWIHKHLPFKK